MDKSDKLISMLGLEAHPEGGYFKETYRSPLKIHSPAVQAVRHAMTDIYFLLTSGQFSRFHQVKHDELWNFYEGGPLRLYDYDAVKAELKTIILGPMPDCDAYKYVIAADHWQAAEPMSGYTLAGCTVAPGFDFNDFSFFEKDSLERKRLMAIDPDLSRLI